MRIEETGNDGAGGPPGSEDRTAGGADGAELAGDPGCGEEGEAAYARGTGRCRGRVAERRRPFTFVLDRDGFIRVIAVAAEKCDYARTALWAPHRYIKLGDSYKRVLYRYGWPDDQIGFSWSSPGGASVGGGLVSVSFNQTSRTYTRDMMLRYEEENNIAFTLHDMVVTRIHIWE